MGTGALDGFATATEMLRALRAGEISSAELLDLHVRRIERYNPTLTAIVAPDFDHARQAATAADAARARGEQGTLLGLPLTIKDCIYVKGLVTTGGVAERAHAVAGADAPVAARVRAAGAVIMGHTNVPPYASDWQSNNPVYGRSNNPWDLMRTPGGSTGGGAAAVAAGLTPLEFGGDFGGSIRIPAAFCGIYGHKTSESLVPRYGHFPGGMRPNGAVAMAVQGPLARDADDLELALDVIAGPGIGEDVAWRVELPAARHEGLSDYRVAVLPPITWAPAEGDIMDALDELVGKLAHAGIHAQTAQPEGFGDLRNYFKTYLGIMFAISAAGQPEEERRKEATELRASGDEFLEAAARGNEASASDYIEWFEARERYRAAYRDFFRRWDVLLAPANIVNAFAHGTEHFQGAAGQLISYMNQAAYPALCNLSGQPGTAFPVTRTRAGLPIGLQAIGPYLEDRTPIRFAALVAREFGGYQRPPGYDAVS